MLVWGFGSRHLAMPDPRSFIFSIMDRYFEPGDTLITGGAVGTDNEMEKYVADTHGDDRVEESIKPYPFRGGALARNVTLAKKCDRAIGIWNTAWKTGRLKVNTSDARVEMNRSGTLHSIVQAIRHRKPLVLIVILPGNRHSIVHLKNDLIPDDSRYALARSC